MTAKELHSQYPGDALRKAGKSIKIGNARYDHVFETATQIELARVVHGRMIKYRVNFDKQLKFA